MSLQQAGEIHHIAQPEIEMAVHPLQGGNDHTLLRRWNPEDMAIQFSGDTALDHSLSH